MIRADFQFLFQKCFCQFPNESLPSCSRKYSLSARIRRYLLYRSSVSTTGLTSSLFPLFKDLCVSFKQIPSPKYHIRNFLLFYNNKDWHGTVALPDLIIQENMYRLRKILTASTTFCRDLPHFYFFTDLRDRTFCSIRYRKRRFSINFSINNKKISIINYDNLQYYLKIFLECCEI